jgi:hypothetical protein
MKLLVGSMHSSLSSLLIVHTLFRYQIYTDLSGNRETHGKVSFSGSLSGARNEQRLCQHYTAIYTRTSAQFEGDYCVNSDNIDTINNIVVGRKLSRSQSWNGAYYFWRYRQWNGLCTCTWLKMGWTSNWESICASDCTQTRYQIDTVNLWIIRIGWMAVYRLCKGAVALEYLRFG